MPELIERHEIRVPTDDGAIVFVADSEDRRLCIRQERKGKKPSDMCAISLSNPDELRGFFMGLRKMLAALGHAPVPDQPAGSGRAPPRALGAPREQDRDAMMAQAREKNPQAFAPWTREEEEEIKARHARGESIQSIARARKRSPRAIELRLRRLGALPPGE